MINLHKVAKVKISFLEASRFLLAAFLIIFPFQIQSLVYTGTSFFSGNFNPYQVFAVHMADIALIAAFFCWGVAHIKGEVKEKLTFGDRKVALLLMLFAFVILFGVVFEASDRVLAFYLMLQMGVMGLFFIMVVNGVLGRDELIRYFLAGMVIQAALAVVQYSLQGSIGIGFIGEPKIGAAIPGVAKIDWQGMKLVRAYGTFPHANILGGALFIALVLGFYIYRKKHLMLVALTVIVTAGFLLSFSRSAVFALLAGFLLYVSLNEDRRAFKYVLLAVSLLLFFIIALGLDKIYFQRFFVLGESDALTERIEYMTISKKMMLEHPLGVGLGGFTTLMQDFSSEKILPWVFQPVHNVYMLVANETGFPGAGVMVLLLMYIFYAMVVRVSEKDVDPEERNYGQILLSVFGGVAVICFFDHYFFTIYQGQVMSAMLLGMISLYLKKVELPRRKS